MDAENIELIENLNFEQALAELEKIVGSLEQGNVALEQSIEIYGRGEALKKHCQTLLRAAEDKVEKIKLTADGSPQGSEALDAE